MIILDCLICEDTTRKYKSMRKPQREPQPSLAHIFVRKRENKVYVPSRSTTVYLLHQVLIRFLDAGVRDRLLRVADGINHVSLTTLPLSPTPAA